jgi:predicted helicase
MLAGFNEYIVEEANAAAEIKKQKPIMVVLGNPPYSGISANASMREFVDPKTGKWQKKLTWIGELIRDYYKVDGNPLGERNPKWLQDDYVKFIRFGQWRIERTGQGILGFITNHAYLDNPTFRGMRQSLMNAFTDIYILDLHGSAKKRETTPDGGKDENVFDIQQGVAIGLFVKQVGKVAPAKVHHADLWGLREGKYHTLFEMDITTTDWEELKPDSPFYFFVSRHEDFMVEYSQGWKVTDIFSVNSVGIVTSRDHFVLDFDEAALHERIVAFREAASSDDEVRERFGLRDKEGWTVSQAREAIRQNNDWQNAFIKCLYRPFDVHPIFYHNAVIERTRPEVMRHMLAGENVALITSRRGTLKRCGNS